MASFVPAKSQPLHNFEFPPLLKWSKGGKSSGSHKRRRSMMSPPQRPSAASGSPISYSPLRDYAAESRSPSQEFPAPPSPDYPVAGGDTMSQTPVCEGMRHLAVGGGSETLSLLREEARRSSRGGDWSKEPEDPLKGEDAVIEFHRDQFKKSAFCSLISEKGKFEKKSKAAEADAAAIKKCNLPIKIGSNSSKEEVENPMESPAKIENNEEHGEIDGVGKERKVNNKSDEEIRLWNLRPRNARSKLEKEKVCGEMSGKSKVQPQLRSGATKSGAKEGKSSSGGGEKRGDKEKGEKKEKKKLSITIGLTKEEIEEDVFALTGSKPSRRPKKRPKNVQKQLDLAFPGLWLVSITPESYKVSENSLKV